jgi:hypothetical protein
MKIKDKLIERGLVSLSDPFVGKLFAALEKVYMIASARRFE